MADDPSIIFTALTANPDGRKPRQTLDEQQTKRRVTDDEAKK